MSRMGKRVVFGAILIAILIAVLWADWRLEQVDFKWAFHHGRPGPLRGLPITAAMGIICAFGFREIRRLSAAAGAPALPISGMVGVVALATHPLWWLPAAAAIFGEGLPADRTILPALLLAFVFAEQMARRRTEGAMGAIASTTLAIAYLGGCGAVVIWIRHEFGVPALVLLLAAAKFTDIGAYFTGSFFGRHKLIPWLSPGKSWEGLAGGLVVGACACMGLAVLMDWLDVGEKVAWIEVSPWQGALFGAVVGLAGQFADLCESLLKRSAGLKDSGAVVPEFGGVLDIVDSVFLSAPVAAIMLAAMD
jgi:phosphatidate cytidylyltransferase